MRLERFPAPHLTVLSTSELSSVRSLFASVDGPLITVQTASYNLGQLDEMMGAVQKAIQTDPLLSASTAMITTREGADHVTVLLKNLSALTSAKGTMSSVPSTVAGVPVTFEAGAVAEATTIRGGVAGSSCTSGFSVTDNTTGTGGMLTAQHCPETQTVSGVALPFVREIASGATSLS